MDHSPWIAWTILVSDYLIRIGLSLRVIMRRRPVGVTLAWLGVIVSSPFFGGRQAEPVLARAKLEV